MPSCRELEPLVTPYIDGEVTDTERAVVNAHLTACPPCRQRVEAEAAVRHTVRARLCRPCAPDALKARCRAAARTGPFGLRPMSVTSLSMAAALVLIAGGVLLYGLTRLSPTVLAAQLTLDHIKCFAVDAGEAAVDVRASELQYERDYGMALRLPRPAVAGLDLVGVRRCYCGEGAAAHAMYRLRGSPVSLYVMRNSNHARASAEAFGHDAVIWSGGDATYVLVGREPRAALEQLAAAMEASLLSALKR